MNYLLEAYSFGKILEMGKSTIKTKVTTASVKDFINAVADEGKRKDGFTLLDLFTKITGEKAKIWGASIIGFGQFHYKSERSRQEGDWPLTGFSPRKQALTLYLMSGFEENTADLLKKLGKYKTGKGCLYINKLTDVNLAILEKMIKQSYATAKKKYEN